MKRMQFLVKTLRERPWRVLVWPLSIVYLVATIALYEYIYNGTLVQFYRTFPAYYTVSFTAFTIVISILFGVVLTLFLAKIREIRLKGAGLGITGIFFGALAAGCPGCVFGLFPIVLSLFGISGTLAILPFNGLEFQALTVLLLLSSIFFLAKESEIACEIKKK